MKQNRRLLSIVLAICLVIGLLPAVIAAEDTAELTYGPSVGIGANAVQAGQTVTYGDGQWFVLDNHVTTAGSDGIAVIARDIVEANIAFNKGGLDNAWASSDAKIWIADYAANAFSAAELSAIMDTTKAEAAGTYFDIAWGKDALDNEKVFFLSAAEVEQYFGDSIEGLIASVDGAADGWWLRSAYTDRDILAGVVSDAGYVGYPHVAATWGARPAFNIASDKIILTSAAVGGKVSGEAGADGLVAVEETTAAEWKLTVADVAHSSFAATIGDGSGSVAQNIGYESWQLPVSFSGAVAGSNEFVSVLICNQNNNAVYYGHIASNTESGSVAVNMPAGLSGKYTIYVFAEQCNGDNATDFASAAASAAIVIDDGMSSVNSWNLTLEGDIRADFLMDLSDVVTSDPEAYISVTVDGNEKNTLVSDLVVNENGLYRLSANVAAAQMTEDIVIQVVTSEAEGNEYLYSVRKYGDYMLANCTDQAIIDLVKALLNYGATAQHYFNYNLGDLADDGISIVEHNIPYTEGLAAVKTGSSENVKFYGASLIHEHQTTLRYYFSADSISKIAGLTFTAKDSDGNVIEGYEDMTVTVSHPGLYYVEVVNIPPNQLYDEVTISVDGLDVTYSPFYYIHRMFYKASSSDALKDLMLGMYNYYFYAVAYLNK